MKIIREKNGIAIIEIDDKFRVVGIGHAAGQVTSVMPSDMPKSGVWFGSLTENGVKYVAAERSFKAALSGFYRAVNFENCFNN